MTLDTSTPQPGDAKTTVGNYFIANYPPFSFWQPEQRSAVMAALAESPDPATPLGVYVHIPFCRRRCHFCYFRVYTGRAAKPDHVDSYIDALLSELQLYAVAPLLQGRRPRFVYFGGGTPSFLSPEQMTQLITGMQAELPWDDVEEVTFECEPGTLTQEKLTALYRLGVSRISLGIAVSSRVGHAYQVVFGSSKRLRKRLDGFRERAGTPWASRRNKPSQR